MSADRPVPTPTPETRFYWDGARSGKLLLQRCTEEGGRPYFPPRNFCPRCGSRNVEVVECSGKATLYSYVISHRPAPGFVPPYAIAVVELEEGPRMMTSIVDCDPTPEALQLDMPLEVDFLPLGDIHLPVFKRARART